MQKALGLASHGGLQEEHGREHEGCSLRIEVSWSLSPARDSA
jgi:hypothetical protein